MRDNRFIELVNLYIDRQITAEETAELEAEMQANPRRRAVYRQYCQLHSATKQVYAGFRAQANEPQAGAPAGRVVRAEFARRPRAHWIHYAGGLAAAACLAVVFVRYNANSQPVETMLAETAKEPSTQVAGIAPSAPATVPEAVAVAAPAATVVRLENSLTAEPNYSALLTALRQEEQRTFATSPLQSDRLPSLFDDGVFDTRPMLPANSQREFRGRQAPKEPAQFTAFQFQR
jgi:hypothetical protein